MGGLTGLSTSSSAFWGAIVVLTAFGFGVGTLAGLFGVGGGFVVTPLLNVLFHIPYPQAVGSTLSFTVGTSSSALARHIRLNNVDLKTFLIVAGGSVGGTFIGVDIMGFLERIFGSGDNSDLTLVLHGLFILLLCMITWLVIPHRTVRPKEHTPLLQRIHLPPFVDLPTAEQRHVSLFGLTSLGFGIGIFTGLLGVGGGVMLMPALLMLVGLRIHRAVGTSLGCVLVASMTGTVKHALVGHANLGIAMPLLIGGTLGAQVGVWLCMRFHAHRLQNYFVFVVVAVILVLGWDLARMLIR